VPAVASDPPSPAEGDIWYNSTTGQIKFRTQIGAWSSGGNLNRGRIWHGSGGSGGSQTSAIVASGYPPGAECELYDGTTWTEVNDLGTANYGSIMLATVNTSAVIASGYNTRTANSYSWDGSNWTSTTSVNNIKGLGGGAGSSTAGVLFAGSPSPGVLQSVNTETWDGSTWTEVNDLGTGRYQNSGVGTSTAALCLGGNPPAPTPATAQVESWDGTSWTEVNDLSTTVKGANSFGTQTSAVSGGGSYGAVFIASTETWDGTSWTSTSSDMSIAGSSGSAGGTSTAGIASGRNTDPGTVANTEEWNFGPASAIVG
jgi:hypothetical protein